METIIIQPKDEAELNFFLELAKRLGTKFKTFDELQDQQLLYAMEENLKSEKTTKNSVINTLHKILNEDQPPYDNES
jgi:hypothetical protein